MPIYLPSLSVFPNTVSRAEYVLYKAESWHAISREQYSSTHLLVDICPWVFNPFQTNFVFSRGGSRADATSKMESFVIIVNGWKPLTIITKRSILDVAAALDPPLFCVEPVIWFACTWNTTLCWNGSRQFHLLGARNQPRILNE